MKAINLRMNEAEIFDIKKLASVFGMTMTDVIREAIKEYLEKMKQNPFYKLTNNIQEASPEESEDILAEIDALTDDDLSIAAVERFTV